MCAHRFIWRTKKNVCRISILIMCFLHRPSMRTRTIEKCFTMHNNRPSTLSYTFLICYDCCVFWLSTHVKCTRCGVRTLKPFHPIHYTPARYPFKVESTYTSKRQQKTTKTGHNASIFIITPLMLSKKYVKFCVEQMACKGILYAIIASAELSFSVCRRRRLYTINTRME